MRSFIAAALIALAIGAGLPLRAEPLSAASTASLTPAAAVAPVVAAVEATPPAAAPQTPGDSEPAKPVAPPAPSLLVDIDLTRQRMTVQAGGKPLHSWAISSGRHGFLTPRGSFRPQWAAKMWYSRKYDDAPMPHAVFFNGGVAVHATGATGLLGSPASHGCVRLAPGNAATFYNLVYKHGFKATRIVVHGNTPAAAVARRSRDTAPTVAYRGQPRPVRLSTPPSVRVGSRLVMPSRPRIAGAPSPLIWPGTPQTHVRPPVIYRAGPTYPYLYGYPVRVSRSAWR